MMLVENPKNSRSRTFFLDVVDSEVRSGINANGSLKNNSLEYYYYNPHMRITYITGYVRVGTG